jgi:glycosyltransferase involved in cell wall biosynthesis
MFLGVASEDLAQQFVRTHTGVKLGSKSKGGTRRVFATDTAFGLDFIKSNFSQISATTHRDKLSHQAAVVNTPVPCIHRGSKRHTCCGSPELWICRELKSDCVSTAADAAQLRGMVATQEALSVKVCEACSYRKCSGVSQRSNPRVGFLSAAYMPIGGTETFHRSLLPRLRENVDITGFVATAFYGGDGSKLQVPYETGIESAKRLASECDIVVVWGIHQLATILPANHRPKVIAVHHSDCSSDWNNNLILTQLNLIDEVVCVNGQTANTLKSCEKPVHYIPNAIDPNRITPSGKQSGLRSIFNINPESKIVLFGHRLNSEKRPHLAVQIARRLPHNWTMVIVGDGPERESVSKSNCDRLRYAGQCETLADWLAVSDCFLSLATFEGFGFSVGEAIAAGVPAISTPTGIAPGLATTIPVDATVDQWVDAIVNSATRIEPDAIIERFSIHRLVSAWTDVIKTIWEKRNAF